ncbi:MAG TPA: BamA/TamA family outer membrane protein [Bacteroidia bacterium]|nr:BamA/TamA family outer membrane protein [Bacteroidia bacterium]
MAIKTKNLNLDKDEMLAIVKQKPNRKILGLIRFHLGVYNFAHKDTSKRFRRWLENTVGEPPLLLDTMLTKRSSAQLQLYLNKNGYFKAQVKDTTIYRNKKATVNYKIVAGKPYLINKITYDIYDTLLKPIILGDTALSIVKSGQIYTEGNLQAERQRITNNLRNNGYYQFVNEYIYFEGDSALKSNKVNIELTVTDRYFAEPIISDTTFVEAHKTFVIENIYIYPEYTLQKELQVFNDTLKIGDNIFFCYNNELKFKTSTILKPILFAPNKLFSQSDIDNTYKRFNSLRTFKTSNLEFVFTREDMHKGYLNAYVKLIPRKKQTYSVAAEGTNSSGNLGISGSVVYQNRNVFKGAEIFEIKLRGGLEVQQLAVDVNAQADNVIPIKTFNTVEIGPEFSLTTPRSIFPFLPKSTSPRSTFSASTNYQQRPDYSRIVVTTAYSVNVKLNNFVQLFWTPIDVNYLWINKSAAFQASLDRINDILIKQSYYNLLISSVGLKSSLIYSNQELKARRNHTYLRFSFEPSGNFITAYYKLLGKEKTSFVNDNNDSIYAYRVFNLAYSQFIRTELDLRKYFDFGLKRKLVLRGVVGTGVPYGNSQAMPFVRSFFAGGTTDIRAWVARTLGPGTFPRDDENSFEQIGDIKVMGNIEYRYNIFKALNAALFVDFGNIWMIKPDSVTNRNGGQFKFSKFYKQFAYGAGVGLRYDFSFFIIRLDLAVPVQDPSMIGADKLYIKTAKLKDVRPNIGINYPF